MTAASASKSTIITVVAIVTAIVGIINLCISGLAITGGAFLGSMGQVANQIAQESGETLTEAEQQAISTLSSGGGALVTILGIAVLAVAVALLVDAVGLFQSKPWTWMLTMVLYGVLLVIQIISILTAGFNIVSLIWVIVAAAIIFLFYTNADVKRTLGQPV